MECKSKRKWCYLSRRILTLQSSFPDEERSLFPSNDHIHLQYIFCFWFNLAFAAFLFLFLAESLNLRFGPGFNFFAFDIFFINTITEHAHNLSRMSSNLRSIAYDSHYCSGSKNYRRQNKMTFSPELYM